MLRYIAFSAPLLAKIYVKYNMYLIIKRVQYKINVSHILDIYTYVNITSLSISLL